MKHCTFAIIQLDPMNKYNETWLEGSYGNPTARLAEIEIAISKANNEVKKEEPPADIKIAICPEHFLAKQHKPNSESAIAVEFFHTIAEVIPVFQKLKLISDKYPDWLIIPGSITIFGYTPIKGSEFDENRYYPPEHINRTSTASEDASFLNTTLGQRLSEQAKLIKLRPETEFKPCYNISPIYYNGKIIKLRRKKYEAYDDQASLELQNTAAENVFFPINAKESPTFVFKGLQIGIEICAEHEHGLLKFESPDTLDLHIIISNEVFPFQEHSSLKENGRLVHVGTTTTGIYRKQEIPVSEDSLEFDYQESGKPGIHIKKISIEEAIG